MTAMPNNAIDPKEVTITTGSGESKQYLLSKFPAIQGREIVCKYPVSGIPKLGDYNVNEETMLKLMKHVYVLIGEDGNQQYVALMTKDLVNNHVPDWEALFQIEKAMIEYNCSFFGDGKASDFLNELLMKLQASTTKTLTDLLEQLSNQDKPASKN